MDISFTVCLFVFLFFCPQDILVTDISGVGWPRAVSYTHLTLPTNREV